MENIEGTSDNRLVVDILDSDDYDGIGDNTEDAIIVDEDGTRWCTLKTAAEITNLSPSTIRRYFKNNKLTGKEGVSAYGRTYYVLFDEVQALAEDKEYKKASNNLRVQDSRIELERFLSQYESKHIGPLSEQVSRLEEMQANAIQTMTTLGEKEDAITQNIEILIKKNEELCNEVNILKGQIEEQKQQLEEEKKKGFWSKLFGKK